MKRLLSVKKQVLIIFSIFYYSRNCHENNRQILCCRLKADSCCDECRIIL